LDNSRASAHFLITTISQFDTALERPRAGFVVAGSEPAAALHCISHLYFRAFPIFFSHTHDPRHFTTLKENYFECCMSENEKDVNMHALSTKLKGQALEAHELETATAAGG
jgi:hypothetical protein